MSACDTTPQQQPTDAQFSTMAILEEDTQGKPDVVERVSYDPYGQARHHGVGDLDGDGWTAVTDNNILLANWGNYGKADIDRSGTVNVNDQLDLNNDWNTKLNPGQISMVDNQIGWDGYVFNAETGGIESYTVRHRSYDTTLGRWLERDPLGTMSSVLAYLSHNVSLTPLRPSRVLQGMTGNTDVVPARQYFDGMSLYQYGRSNALSHRDPSGLECPCPPKDRRSKEECCSAARDDPNVRGASGGHSAGGVVCCDGVAYPCSFWGPAPDNPKLEDIVSKCIEEHERRHLRRDFDRDPCKSDKSCGTLYRPPSNWTDQRDVDEGECKAYLVEYYCWVRAIKGKKCSGILEQEKRRECELRIIREKDRALRKIEEHCKGIPGYIDDKPLTPEEIKRLWE